MSEFKDRFSGHAADYASYRPHYPPSLFEYLAAIAPNRIAAWDCATGNGQAAEGLAKLFDRVIATDASEKQIANARPNDRIEFRVATAEHSGLAGESVALITIAQALHWFHHAEFFFEAERVLQSGGLLAAWCYELFTISPAVDRAIERFYREQVGPYWDAERRLVETGYRTIEFPFQEIAPPQFKMQAEWSLDQVLGYLRTWSATKAFIAHRGFDPVSDLEKTIRLLWGKTDSRSTVTWPLSLVVRRRINPENRKRAGLATHPLPSAS